MEYLKEANIEPIIFSGVEVMNQFNFEEAAKPFNLPQLRQKAKFIAIATTSGTATEVTSFSVITDNKTGKVFDIPHGVANAIYLPAVIQFNAKAAKVEYANIAKRLGLAGNNEHELVEALVNLVKDLRNKMGIVSSLNKLNISIKNIEGIWTVFNIFTCKFIFLKFGYKIFAPLVHFI